MGGHCRSQREVFVQYPLSSNVRLQRDPVDRCVNVVRIREARVLKLDSEPNTVLHKVYVPTVVAVHSESWRYARQF